ncbi:hypothetical protein NQ314_017063 [Rhamnusium bicolor]|uniref:DDE Tnp4 domain-containing protein n=1 Tax=Rhamnusium bicolor TaxID=1586634 RepID=A0AAV8WUB6_9CUCU|nr:hypothetical protein NQ314_017063 [Rhamnusium bicolor]
MITRVKIEHAFALLKGRFRRLKDFLDINEEQNIVYIIVVCYVLHNICIMHGDDKDIAQYINEGLAQVDLINIQNADGNINEQTGVILRE